MAEIFPKSPFVPAANQGGMPGRTCAAPAAIVRRHDYFKTYKILPPGMPDCLEVSVIHFAEGTERCTAAIYGGHAYLIHYAFSPRDE